jgi:hypothetical protein
MPRKSAAELATPPAPQVPGQGRPPPPEQLDVWERAIWKEVVAALPAYWLDGAGQQVLIRLVAQIVVAERCERRLRQMRNADLDDTKAARALVVHHAAIAKAVTYLLTALRGTPRSRVVSRDAGPEIEKAPAFRPWETRAEDGDTTMQ